MEWSYQGAANTGTAKRSDAKRCEERAIFGLCNFDIAWVCMVPGRPRGGWACDNSHILFACLQRVG